MPEAVKVSSRREGNIGILATDGYINSEQAEPVAEAGHTLIEEGVRSLVLNLESIKP